MNCSPTTSLPYDEENQMKDMCRDEKIALIEAVNLEWKELV